MFFCEIGIFFSSQCPSKFEVNTWPFLLIPSKNNFIVLGLVLSITKPFWILNLHQSLLENEVCNLEFNNSVLRPEFRSSVSFKQMCITWIHTNCGLDFSNFILIPHTYALKKVVKIRFQFLRVAFIFREGVLFHWW